MGTYLLAHSAAAVSAGAGGVPPALLNLQGGYASAWNVVAAGSLLAAVPTAIVFFMFQKQFVSGLLVGANK